MTTDATVTDVERFEQVHTDRDRRSLLPGEHIVDAGYTSDGLRPAAAAPVTSPRASGSSDSPRGPESAGIRTAARHPTGVRRPVEERQ